MLEQTLKETFITENTYARAITTGLLGGVACVGIIIGLDYIAEPVKDLVHSTRDYIGPGGEVVAGVLTAAFGVVATVASCAISVCCGPLISSEEVIKHGRETLQWTKKTSASVASVITSFALSGAVAMNMNASEAVPVTTTPETKSGSTCSGAELVVNDDGQTVTPKLPTGCYLKL